MFWDPSSPSLTFDLKNEPVKTGVIYRLGFPNGKSYIGQTRKSAEKRWSQHRIKTSRLVGNAIAKYGWDNITKDVLVRLPASLLNEYEVKFISMYDSCGKHGYNLTPGGDAIPMHQAAIHAKVVAKYKEPQHRAKQKAGCHAHKAKMSKEKRVAAVNLSWEVRRANPRDRSNVAPYKISDAHLARREARLAKYPPEEREQRRAIMEAHAQQEREKYRKKMWQEYA
tara:strand:+ start:1767 stop:2441 length:675 start_codon:yes stop_codon:yes gene_type:complete